MNRNDLLLGATIVALNFSGGAGEAPAWIQLTPVSAGAISGRDGRQFKIADAGQVMTNSMRLFGQGANRLPIDYDHAIDLAANKGGTAPAAGWIVELAAHGPANEPGIWGRVEWTDKGRAAVAGREYGFVSPALFTDAKGTVAAIGRAALTNNPNLTLKSLNAMESPVDLTKIAAALGLPATATEDDIIKAITAMMAEDKAEMNAARTKLVLNAAGLGDKAEITDDIVAALCTKLKTPAAANAGELAALRTEVNALNVQLIELRKAGAMTKAEADVDAAIKAGKLVPSQRSWALNYASADPEGFKTLVGVSPTILADGSVAPQAGKDGAPQLNAEQKQIAAQLGLSEEAYIKELNASTKGA